MLNLDENRSINSSENRTSMKNFKQLIESVSLVPPKHKKKHVKVYKSYFRKLFRFLSKKTERLSLMALVNYLPFNYFITKNIYRSFHCSPHNHTQSNLKRDDFVKGMVKLYYGSSKERISLLFDILNFSSNGIVLKDDVKVLFSHLYSLSNSANLKDGYSIIDDFFQSEKSISKDSFILKAKRQNSDLFFLFIYLIHHHTPIDESSIDYYSTHIYHKDSMTISTTDEERDDDVYRIPKPSGMLYAFLNTNFSCSYVIESELDDLDAFEENIENVINESFTQCNMIQESNSLTKQKKIMSSCCVFKHHIEFDPIQFNSNDYDYDNKGFKPSSSTDINSRSSHQIANILFDNLYDFYMHSNEAGFSLHKLEIVGNDLYTYEVISESQLRFQHIFPLTQLYFIVDDNNKTDSIEKIAVHLISTLCNSLEDSVIYFDSIAIANQLQRTIETKTKFRRIEDDYEFISVLGKGSFGTVLEAEEKRSKKHYAVKAIQKTYETEGEGRQIRMEKDIMCFIKQFPHKGIVKAIDVYETYDTLYIVQEYIRNGDLKALIEERNHDQRKLSISLAYEIMMQLIDAISYLKSFGIVHRDLKTENVLIKIKDKDSKGNCTHNHQKIHIKIIDFGLSSIIGKEEQLTDKLGTLCYLPPEILSSKPYDFKIDVWTLGVICYCMLYGKHPFIQSNMVKVIDKINHQTIPLPEIRHDNERERNLRKFIEECLQKDTNFRPSIDSIVKQFFNTY